jgi:hypothetical protein
MNHDPVSFLLRRTEWDTLRLTLPRAEGLIKGEEIPTRAGYYRLSGTVIIHGGSIGVNLYYDHPDATKSRVNLNGIYTLKWTEK